MSPFTSVTECPFKIGRTPLTRFRIILGGQAHELLLKEERYNEFGSIKDRVAWYVLSQTLAKVGPVRSVIDASSGNYGYALARICERLGIDATIVSSPSISAYNATGIKAAGARLIIAEARAGESSNAARMRVAHEISEQEGQTFLDQYANFLNPESHAVWTAPEVLAEGPFDAVFVTSSSGGTARGFDDYLKARKDPTPLFLVEPDGSGAFLDPVSEPGAKLKIPGYGSQRRSTFSGMKAVPNMIRMDEAATLAAFSLLHEHGLAQIGLSSTGVMLGAIDWLSRQKSPKRAVCICADGDERYLDEFESRYVPSVERTAYDAAHANLAPVIRSMVRRPENSMHVQVGA